MTPRPRVHVVLATFEPRADWLREQVRSILLQQDVDLSLDVCDDGSGPATQSLLATLLDGDERCSWSSGQRLGSAANFGRGLARAPRDVDAILLSDQDDIWDEDKAIRSIRLLDAGHLLVHGDARLVDADGNELPGTLFSIEERDRRATDQGRLIIRNVVTGCTLACRPSLLDAALPFPSLVGNGVHHDLWLALCAASVGSIGLIDGTLLAYRQHAANVVGAVEGYGRWQGWRDAAGSWALRQRIARTLGDLAAAGRLPPLPADVAVWSGPRAERRTRALLATHAREPGLTTLVSTLRRGALAHSLRRSTRAPLARIRRTLRLSARALLLAGVVARDPRRMLGGIARNAGIVDQPLRIVPATSLGLQARPLRVSVSAGPRTLQFLIPGISPSGVFGGVGTAVALAVRLAELGERVQFILTDYGQPLEAAEIRRIILRHVDTRAETLERIGVVKAIHDDVEIPLGSDDVLIATAWWTAFRAAGTIAAQPGLQQRRFVYLVQDDETLFYETSERQLLAARSYTLDALHVINSRPLATHLRQAHAIEAPDELVFAPIVAVPERHPLRPVEDVLRVVVYGRPSVGRNLFDTALRGLAIWDAARRSAGDATRLDVVSVGEPEQFRYRIGETPVRAPGVLSWDEYLDLLASSHLGVSLMTSPHPSYPPLEMAMSGLVVVTNRWGPKDLSVLSERIVSCAPDADGVAAALTLARARLDAGGDPAFDLAPLGSVLTTTAAALQQRIIDGALRTA